MDSTSKECPKCGAHKVMRIVYGLIQSSTVLKDDEIPGGCTVFDREWHYDKCHWEWNNQGEGEYNPPEDDE